MSTPYFQKGHGIEIYQPIWQFMDDVHECFSFSRIFYQPGGIIIHVIPKVTVTECLVGQHSSPIMVASISFMYFSQDLFNLFWKKTIKVGPCSWFVKQVAIDDEVTLNPELSIVCFRIGIKKLIVGQIIKKWLHPCILHVCMLYFLLSCDCIKGTTT